MSEVINDVNSTDETHGEDPSRRDFIYIATGAAAAAGAGAIVWPLITQMGPAADTLAVGSIEIDLSKVDEGQQLKVLWRGKPVFVRHRTAKEIAEAESVDLADLKDPATDDSRLRPDGEGKLNPQYLVMVGVCTHFGCIPVGEAGDFDGWYCPCHGSHYDTSGRIRKGPAPLNLVVPEYEYLSANRIKVG
ncbi:ubiquinol-cytochrome c reductase iron-sulfur subunit [Robiginitomaculum antarcticum]|uniref:ubiquinol-cytochrome c reductase iron-sulfur subunit n=1 Tax=Robiginitomaculum antarcticum TaxID=437507 RepID=UPI00036C27BC|nr:ubiquinol-cytochrome c reductase iron-sulfur subunit [Robiginitomaculum antarcticum]